MISNIGNILSKILLSCQTKNNIFFTQEDIKDVCARHKSDLEDILRDPRNKSLRAVLNVLLLFHEKYGPVFPSHMHIASRLGLSRRHVIRLIQKLEELKLVKSLRRRDKGKKNRTSLYIVNKIFNDPVWRSRLSHILTSLFQFSLFFLFSSVRANAQNFHPEHYVTAKTYFVSKLGIYTYHRIRSPRSSMEQLGRRVYGENPISLAIREIKTIAPTKWGQIRLMVFPEDAIRDADNKMQYAKNVKDPFALFFSLCLKYCAYHAIEPNWEIYKALARAYQMPAHPKLLMDKHSTLHTPSYPSLDEESQPRYGYQRQQQGMDKAGYTPKKKAYNPHPESVYYPYKHKEPKKCPPMDPQEFACKRDEALEKVKDPGMRQYLTTLLERVQERERAEQQHTVAFKE